jgi:hypothetical protein
VQGTKSLAGVWGVPTSFSYAASGGVRGKIHLIAKLDRYWLRLYTRITIKLRNNPVFE